MKKILLLSFAGMFCFTTAKSQTVANARMGAVGSNVTVRGVVINGSELGIIRYVQDNTGGIAAYGGNLSGLNKGDSVIIAGTLTEYNNLFEITPATFTLVQANATLPNPQVITANQFGEPHEGKLVKILTCAFTTSGTFSTSAANYNVTANSQPFQVRTNSSLGGVAIPSGTVNITGIGSQYCQNPSSGCTNGYQLLIRNSNDLSTATAPTGLNELNTAGKVMVYPNPVSDAINFKIDTYETITSASITNILGEVVYSAESNATSIDVSTFKSGIYNLVVVSQSGLYKTKFVVAK